ncbi:MAG TPA: sugar ABC transporter substrate-binding protein [Oceanobacillus sp.]|nr:sugar ABC transporter substrate-binding protein [Oceanobacillus sp.]
MKHKYLFVVMAIVSVFSLSIGALAQDDVVIAPQACAEPGSLTMWVWDENWAEIIGNAIDLWIEEYCPGAEVDLQVQPWAQYWDLLRTNAAGGTLPDVFNMNQPFFGDYADVVLNLQPYLDEAGIDTSIWGSGMIDPYRVGEDGDLTAVPVNWDTIAIYYNKDMLDAAGLEYPDADWTWDDFAEYAEALTDPDNDVYGAAVYSEFQAGYANWIAATGIAPIVNAERTECTVTAPESIEALTFLKDLQDAGYMPTISTMGGSSADDSFNFWLAGRVAMVSGGSWKLSTAFEQATFNWDVVKLPRHPDMESSRSILHAVGYVASANTPNPDLAANLILFLGSDEGQQFFAEGGNVAPANPGLQDEWIDSFGDTDVNVQTFVDAIQNSQGVTFFGEINDVVGEIPVNIFDLGVSPEEAAQQACDAINEYLPR